MVGHGTQWLLQYGDAVGAHVAVKVGVGVFVCVLLGVESEIIVPVFVGVGVRLGVIVVANAVVTGESQRHSETRNTKSFG